MLRIIGALLILISTAGIGFSIAENHKRSEQELKLLIRMLEYMYHDLQYHHTPLPVLMEKTASQANGTLKDFFTTLACVMQRMVYEDAGRCVTIALHQHSQITDSARRNLQLMGTNLGRFDLPGQLSGLESVKVLCMRDLEGLSNNRNERLRSYRTLAICAGVAIIILLI